MDVGGTMADRYESAHRRKGNAQSACGRLGQWTFALCGSLGLIAAVAMGVSFLLHWLIARRIFWEHPWFGMYMALWLSANVMSAFLLLLHPKIPHARTLWIALVISLCILVALRVIAPVY